MTTNRFSRSGRRIGLKMTAAHYELMGDLVAGLTIPAEAKKAVADQFATAFYRRSQRSFDAYQWNRKTGGEVDPAVIK